MSPRPTASPRSVGPMIRRIAPWRAVLVVLGAIAVLHAVWAVGVPWPASSMDALADTVLGRRPFPPPALTWVVVLLLVAAIGLVIAWQRATSTRWVRLLRLATYVIAGVLLLRGIAGELASITGIEGSTTRYRILDIVLYSPLCLWAGLGIAFARRRVRG